MLRPLESFGAHKRREKKNKQRSAERAAQDQIQTHRQSLRTPASAPSSTAKPRQMNPIANTSCMRAASFSA
jgi:hypothetical protein